MGYFTPGNGYLNGGAWPRGVRRHQEGGDAAALVRQLRKLGLSWRDIEKIVGISCRALRKYLAGILFPSKKRLSRLRSAVAKFCCED